MANFDYPYSSGGSLVAMDLTIVFSDGSWLSRYENEGSEYWRWSTLFTEPEQNMPITTLIDQSVFSCDTDKDPFAITKSWWKTLDELNDSGDKLP